MFFSEPVATPYIFSMCCFNPCSLYNHHSLLDNFVCGQLLSLTVLRCEKNTWTVFHCQAKHGIFYWLVVSNPLKNINHLGLLVLIYGKIKVMFQSPPTSFPSLSQHFATSHRRTLRSLRERQLCSELFLALSHSPWTPGSVGRQTLKWL